MTELLLFLVRGFALFAGGPAVIYPYSPLRRAGALVKTRARARKG
jgi:hypothetical protein